MILKTLFRIAIQHISIGIPVVLKLKLPPQQHKLKSKMLKLRKFKVGIHLGFLFNRLCFCHIDSILKLFNLTYCKKRRRIKIYFH